MNPNTPVYAAIKLNGVVTDWGHCALKHIPAKLGRFIMDSEMDGRMFSTMDLRLSKRPINWESIKPNDIDFTELANVVHIPIVDLDDPIDDESPPITYGEMMELSKDPVWSAYKSLGVGANRDSMSGAEYDQVVKAWKHKYATTKFARLI